MALLDLGLRLRVVIVLGSLSLDLVICELGQLVRSTDVADVVVEALGEDKIDFLETAVGGFGVEEPHDGYEEGVPACEEEVRAPPN